MPSQGKTNDAGVTCLQLERKTSIFELRCDFIKLHNISSFWSSGTIIAVWCKRLGVAVTDSSCTLRYSGSFKLSLARSWTDFVWVAEKRKVCLCFGSCETIAFNAFLNPTSRIRSASSRTKTCSLASKKKPKSAIMRSILTNYIRLYRALWKLPMWDSKCIKMPYCQKKDVLELVRINQVSYD